MNAGTASPGTCAHMHTHPHPSSDPGPGAHLYSQLENNNISSSLYVVFRSIVVSVAFVKIRSRPLLEPFAKREHSRCFTVLFGSSGCWWNSTPALCEVPALGLLSKSSLCVSLCVSVPFTRVYPHGDSVNHYTAPSLLRPC